jgi:hypothetical protein
MLSGSTPVRGQGFQNPVRVPTPVNPSSVMVADLNGDGIPDILYTNVTASPLEVDILLGQKSGGYVGGKPVPLAQKAGAAICRTTDANRAVRLT